MQASRFTSAQTAGPVVLCAGRPSSRVELWCCVCLPWCQMPRRKLSQRPFVNREVFLRLLIVKPRQRALCQCCFSQLKQNYTNQATCPVQLWKYHLGFIELLSITPSNFSIEREMPLFTTAAYAWGCVFRGLSFGCHGRQMVIKALISEQALTTFFY